MMDCADAVRIYASVPTAYFEWIVDRVQPHLSGRILEVGAGPGVVTSILLERGFRVTAIDSDADAAGRLSRLHDGSPGFASVCADAERDDLRLLPGAPFGSALCINVLEHVDDDARVLVRVREAVVSGGRIACLVPAHPALYGSMDARFGHKRRYTRRRFSAALRSAGIEARVEAFDMIGLPAWWWRFRIRQARDFEPLQNRIFGAILPLARAVEDRWGAPVGLSYLAIGSAP